MKEPTMPPMCLHTRATHFTDPSYGHSVKTEGAHSGICVDVRISRIDTLYALKEKTKPGVDTLAEERHTEPNARPSTSGAK